MQEEGHAGTWDSRVRVQVDLDGGHETRTFPLVQSVGLVRYGGATLLYGTASLGMWDRERRVLLGRQNGKKCAKRQTNSDWSKYEPLTL